MISRCSHPLFPFRFAYYLFLPSLALTKLHAALHGGHKCRQIIERTVRRQRAGTTLLYYYAPLIDTRRRAFRLAGALTRAERGRRREKMREEGMWRRSSTCILMHQISIYVSVVFVPASTFFSPVLHLP